MVQTNPVRRDLAHTILSVLFIAVLIVGSFWVMRPFLMPLIWATVIVIATWPPFERLRARLGGRRGPAVAIMAAAILLVFLVPISLAVVTIGRHFGDIASQLGSVSTIKLPALPAWVGGIPVVGAKIAVRWERFVALDPDGRVAVVAPYARTTAQWFVAKAGGAGATLLNFLLTVIIATILYANGETVREGILAFARRLAGRHGEDVAVLAAKSIRGVVLGVVVTALIQAGIGGAGMFLTGVPAAGLLTAVTLMFCLAQLGPILVMIPAVIWLYWSGHAGAGTALLVVTIIAGTLDNVIRPLLIKKGADLPLLLIFSGVIGGLIAFGVVGLFIGPMVLGVTYTLLKEWVVEDAADAEPVAPAGA